jgi:uncharacterized iron-regulated protein
MIRLVFIFILSVTSLRAETITNEIYAEMSGANIVILGEIHDNPLHHKGQANLIERLEPKAIVFEMLSFAQAAIINEGPRSDLDALAVRIDWANSGWPDFSLYAPVFAALGDTPVVGAAAPRNVVRAAFSEGAAAVFGTGSDQFGLDVPPPDAQLKKRSQMQFDAHCEAMPLEMMDGMVEAQRLRDALFSRSTLEALEKYGAPVVVIAGNGHARRDWGMPAMIAQASPNVTTYVVGFVETPNPLNDPRFDKTVPTEPAERDDPCAAFKTK